MPAFMVEIAAIFAREILEGCVIIGQYRNVVKSQDWEEARITSSLRSIWLAAGGAAAFALFLILILGIALNAAGSELSDEAADVIEGVSKLVAAVCIAQLSLKVPIWLGVYPKKQEEVKIGLTRSELLFNVAWNIWREVAEIGAFLIPFFLNNEGLEAIPLSGFVGLLVGLICGGGIYGVSLLLKSKRGLCFFLAFMTAWLSTGLFVGGCHEIEEVAGETAYAWKIMETGWDKGRFPMVMFKPFGYTNKPTILWIVSFIVWAILLVAAHVGKYQWLKRKAAQDGREVGKAEAGEQNVQSETGAAASAV